jgi:Uma2 family endonuclease
VLLNPTLIIAVLSESTALYDRTDKFKAYRNIPSVQEYVLVAQDKYSIENYYKTEEGLWVFSEVTEPENLFTFKSINCSLLVKDLYAKVNFSSKQSNE